MKLTRIIVLSLALLGGISAAPLAARAQEGKGKSLLSDYFPLEVGRRWIYNLRVTAGENTQHIEYTTKVVRQEDLEGVGPCVVTESRSVDRLFTTDFYRVAEGKLHNVERREGKATARFKNRILISEEAIASLAKKDAPAGQEWKWTSADERATGSVRVLGYESLQLRPFGNLRCIVLLDKGTFTYKGGKLVRHQERKMWFAPGIGLVKEFMQVKTDAGVVTLETEALLKHFES